MKSASGSGLPSITIFSKSSLSFRLEAMCPPQRSMLDAAKLSLCWVQFWKGSNMNYSRPQSSEPLQLCLGPEFCQSPLLKYLDRISTSNTSLCCRRLSKQQLLQELSVPSSLPEGSLGSIPL